MNADQAILSQDPVKADLRAVLSCALLRKSYGDKVAVRDLSFEVRSGEAYGLLGPNGAGKSTTIRMICGVVPPDGGTATINGTQVAGRAGREARGELGYVPERIALFPTLTLVENLRFWAQMQGVPRRQRKQRIDEALELVGLADRARDDVAQCSNGMQRRLNLAVALLHRPKLLVLDEPTVGVDPQSRASLMAVLGQMRADGTALLYTSHYMDEVERLCDRVGIIDHGLMLAEGPTDELLAANPGAHDLEELFLRLTGRALRD